jgi:hypothetical protein
VRTSVVLGIDRDPRGGVESVLADHLASPLDLRTGGALLAPAKLSSERQRVAEAPQKTLQDVLELAGGFGALTERSELGEVAQLPPEVVKAQDELSLLR